MLSLITDRTSADVSRWEYLKDLGWDGMSASEQTEWVSDSKGAYNISDLNRVESAVRTIATEFNNAGYSVSLTTKTNWSTTDVPTKSDMSRYLNNIRTLISLTPTPTVDVDIPTNMAKLSFIEANNIEKCLELVYNWIRKVRDFQFYCNDVFAGEV